MSDPGPPSVPLQDNFHIFTTFRLDSTLSRNTTNAAVCGGRHSDIYLLGYHYDRLRNAAASMTGFKLPDCLLGPDEFEKHIQDEVRISAECDQQTSPGQSVVRRGKISVWPDGRLEVLLVPVMQTNPLLFPQSLDDYGNPSWSVVLDSEPTEASLYTGVKTSYRADYDRARQAAGLAPASTTEVLLYNDLDEIMDGSITTAYFYRGNRWVTPQVGGLEGTTRRYALDHGLCSIARSGVMKDSLKDGEIVWLSNAFRGFFPAVFKLR
ncbi:hypothetical protein Q7P37_009256 [Cladosporium fusiforme]